MMCGEVFIRLVGLGKCHKRERAPATNTDMTSKREQWDKFY